MRVTVLGATGKTGGEVAKRLLEAGVGVRAVARSTDKLQALVKAGATAAAADVIDGAALAEALRGSDALYAMIPSDYTKPALLEQYARATAALVDALKASGVRRVVFLSSIGADLPSATGPIVGLHLAEESLRTITGLDLLILRPGYFYENSFGSLGMIKHQGINGGAIAPQVPMTMIAAQDIGVAAADALAKSDFSGVSIRELAGPRPLTMAEVTRILGKAIGKPDLPYIQFPDDGFVQGMQGAGFTEDAARLFLEMAQAFNKELVRPVAGVPRVTTPTTFESFADGFARAFHAA